MFRFAAPQSLYGLALIPVLVLFFLWAFRHRRRALESFGNLELMARLCQGVSRRRRLLKSALLVSAFGFLMLALARPQFGTRLQTVKREGQDVVIALDVSLSMRAEDIRPSRLEKAKHAISSFIDLLKGDRVALVAFAGEAFVQCPLTLDHGAAKMFLAAMDTDLIPLPGTALAEAIRKSLSLFKSQHSHKILILITDGEDHSGDLIGVARESAQQGVVIYCVGIGSPQGTPIPLYDSKGRSEGFKKDQKDQVVMTRLDEMSLQKIALETEGKYYRASPGEAELEKIYDDISKMDQKTVSSQQFTQFNEQFQGFVACALVLLILEVLVAESRKVAKAWKGRFQ
ncbi:MAG: VWA domain-containing protein [Acidobacteriota bacterium]